MHGENGLIKYGRLQRGKNSTRLIIYEFKGTLNTITSDSAFRSIVFVGQLYIPKILRSHFWSSRTPTEACYSLFESLKNVPHSFIFFD